MIAIFIYNDFTTHTSAYPQSPRGLRKNNERPIDVILRDIPEEINMSERKWLYDLVYSIHPGVIPYAYRDCLKYISYCENERGESTSTGAIIKLWSQKDLI